MQDRDRDKLMSNNFWYSCEIAVLCADLDKLLDELVRLRLEGKVYISKYEIATIAGYVGLDIVYDDLNGGEEILFNMLRGLGCEVVRYRKEWVGDLGKVLW